MNNTRNLQNLNISVINNENVQIGCNNTLVVVRGIEDDIPENNNKIPYISEVTLLSGVEKSLKYRSSGPTCISIGNNCTIAELVLNKELLDDLRTGQFTVTKGDNLLAITWYDFNLYQSEQAAADHKAIKIRFSEGQDIHDLEKQVFELLADSKDKKLVQLITKLLNSYKARLKHIKMGCIELEIDLQSDSSVSFLDKKEEIKDLLRRTIIPEGALFDIELQSPPPRANKDQPTSENLENQNKEDVTIGEKDLAPESNKDDCSLLVADVSLVVYKKPEDKDTVDIMEPSSSLLSARYKTPEDKETVDFMKSSSSLLSARYKTLQDMDTIDIMEPSSSLSTARYKIPEDWDTVDLMEPSSSLSPSEIFIDHRAVLIQYIEDSLSEVSERCKTVIKLELIRHLTSGDKILSQLDKSKNKINIQNILQKLDTEFERFYIDLKKIIQLEVERERKRSSLSRYEDVVTTDITESKVRRSFGSILATLRDTTFRKTKKESREAGSSNKITGIIMKKVEKQFQMTIHRCRKNIKLIIESESDDIPEWENTEDKTEHEMKLKNFKILLEQYNMEDDWLKIQKLIDRKVQQLKPEMRETAFRNDILCIDANLQPNQRIKTRKKCIIM